MKTWDMAVIVSIPAESYDDALRQTDALAEGLGMTEGISASAVTDTEHDNEGQRVIYLHDEEQPYQTGV